MTKVVKIFKGLGSFLFRWGLLIAVVILFFNNISLRRENEKQNLIIKNYEEKYLGTDGFISSTESEKIAIETESEHSKDQVGELREKINSIEKRVAILEQGDSKNVKPEKGKEVDISESIKAYLLRKFPFDGNFYKEEGNIQYYSDTFCTQKIDSKNLRFMSFATDYTSAENGLSITCVLTDDWKIVYCTQTPYLVTETEYNEIHYQK